MSRLARVPPHPMTSHVHDPAALHGELSPALSVTATQKKEGRGGALRPIPVDPSSGSIAFL